MKPSVKDPVIEDLISTFAGKSRIDTINNDICINCGKDATKFNNTLSVKEYSISGLCQKCQDEVFGSDSL